MARNAWSRRLYLCCLLLGFMGPATFGAAQDPQLSSSTEPLPNEEPQTSPSLTSDGNTSNHNAAPSQEPDEKNQQDKQDAEDKKDKEKRKHPGAIVVAPLPIVSPAIGAGLIPVLGYIFPFEDKEKASPPSVIGAAGLITNNGSRGFGLLGDIFLKKDTYELRTFYAKGNINYDLFGVGFENGNAGAKLPLRQDGQVFFIEFLRNIGWKFFVGPRFVNGSSLITVNSTSGDSSLLPPDTGLTTNLRAIGFDVERDSRINRFYPTQGMFLQFSGDFFSQGLGSKYSFQSYKLTFNKYHSFGSRQVLAYNLYVCGTGGEPPFYGNCVYGMNNELRGYEAGRYLDRYMYATQLEYRLILKWRLGVVAFGGVGSVAPGADKFRTDQFLPAGGTGLRFLMSKKYHVNLRTDFAWGKDNFTWSVGVGEAF
jgi:Omp85 superfamily domain